MSELPPAAPFYETPDLESAMAARRFAPETADFTRGLAEDGGALIDLGEEGRRLCDAAVAETDPYFEKGRVERVQDAWYRSPAIRRLATSSKVRRLLQAAYGREPFAFQTLNFKQGSQQHFHSDAVHFHSLPERFMCGVWIALEDVRSDAGPLAYKTGSHKLPVLTMQDVGVDSPRPNFDDYARLYVPRFEERLEAMDLPTRRLLIKKGQAFVWTANLAHGGEPIADPASTRRSLVVHFYFKGCVYFTPMTSNPAEKQMTLRLPANVSTGLWTWPEIESRPARLPPKTVLAAVITRLKARPATFGPE